MLDEWLTRGTEFFVPVFDLMALALVAYGTVVTFVHAIRMIVRRGDNHEFRQIWLHYSRWLVAGLTIQLAADIIETALAPSWEEIGKLAAIAVIRTFLNYFLERDQKEVRELDYERMKEQAEIR